MAIKCVFTLLYQCVWILLETRTDPTLTGTCQYQPWSCPTCSNTRGISPKGIQTHGSCMSSNSSTCGTTHSQQYNVTPSVRCDRTLAQKRFMQCPELCRTFRPQLANESCCQYPESTEANNDGSACVVRTSTCVVRTSQFFITVSRVLTSIPAEPLGSFGCLRQWKRAPIHAAEMTQMLHR